ncbi:MAG TPA: hypothetical protein VI384_04320 [Candidatus Dormibacteraeota bacterium]
MELVSEWYRKLPEGSDIERPDGTLRADFAGRNGVLSVEHTEAGTPVSSEHAKLGSAAYRFRHPEPLWRRAYEAAKLLPDSYPRMSLILGIIEDGQVSLRVLRGCRVGRSKAYRVWYEFCRAAGLPTTGMLSRGHQQMPRYKVHAIVRLLAAGVPHRQIAGKVHVSMREVTKVRGDVRRWKDPEDE